MSQWVTPESGRLADYRAHYRADADLIADPADLPPGCAFHPRCPARVEACSARRPELREVRAGHFVACGCADDA